MAQGIIDLILENKKRFYRGEIRNYFYEDLNHSSKQKVNPVLIEQSADKQNRTSWWNNLKTKGIKLSEEFFYEPAK